MKKQSRKKLFNGISITRNLRSQILGKEGQFQLPIQPSVNQVNLLL